MQTYKNRAANPDFDFNSWNHRFKIAKEHRDELFNEISANYMCDAQSTLEQSMSFMSDLTMQLQEVTSMGCADKLLDATMLDYLKQFRINSAQKFAVNICLFKSYLFKNSNMVPKDEQDKVFINQKYLKIKCDEHLKYIMDVIKHSADTSRGNLLNKIASKVLVKIRCDEIESYLTNEIAKYKLSQLRKITEKCRSQPASVHQVLKHNFMMQFNVLLIEIYKINDNYGKKFMREKHSIVLKWDKLLAKLKFQCRSTSEAPFDALLRAAKVKLEFKNAHKPYEPTLSNPHNFDYFERKAKEKDDDEFRYYNPQNMNLPLCNIVKFVNFKDRVTIACTHVR